MSICVLFASRTLSVAMFLGVFSPGPVQASGAKELYTLQRAIRKKKRNRALSLVEKLRNVLPQQTPRRPKLVAVLDCLQVHLLERPIWKHRGARPVTITITRIKPWTLRRYVYKVQGDFHHLRIKYAHTRKAIQRCLAGLRPFADDLQLALLGRLRPLYQQRRDQLAAQEKQLQILEARCTHLEKRYTPLYGKAKMKMARAVSIWAKRGVKRISNRTKYLPMDWPTIHAIFELLGSPWKHPWIAKSIAPSIVNVGVGCLLSLGSVFGFVPHILPWLDSPKTDPIFYGGLGLSLSILLANVSCTSLTNPTAALVGSILASSLTVLSTVGGTLLMVLPKKENVRYFGGGLLVGVPVHLTYTILGWINYANYRRTIQANERFLKPQPKLRSVKLMPSFWVTHGGGGVLLRGRF